MKRVLLTFFMLSLSLSFISAEINFGGNQSVCGDGRCDAGYRLNSNLQVEDMSSCFNDCAFTDWVACDIDTITGGNCIFNGKTFKFTNLERNSCGGMTDTSLNFSVELDGHIYNIEGLLPYNYIPLVDFVSISVGGWPCSFATTKQSIYLRGSMDKNKLNNIMQVLTNNINLKENNILSIKMDFKGLSSPYEEFSITNDETNEVLTSGTGPGNVVWDIYLDPIITKAGVYTATEKIFDETRTNLIAQQSSKIIINECLIKENCNDNKFWTKETCSGNEYKVCSSSVNYLMLGSAILFIILIIILLIFVKRK